MFRASAFLIILLLSMPSFSADPRVERWNLHLERMKKLRGESSAGRAERNVIEGITLSEIKSSEEFIAILDRYRENDGSLKSEMKKYSISEIEKRVNVTASPIVALYYLSELYRTADDSGITEQVSASISHSADKKFRGLLKIPRSETAEIAKHYLFEKGLAEYDSALKSAITEILGKTVYELSRRDYNSNDPDLAAVILKHSEETLVSRKFFTFNTIDERYLSQVPRWRELNSICSKIEDRNRAIMNFVSNTSGSAGKSEPVSDVESAEKEIFLKGKSRISILLENTTPASGTTGNNPVYEIPDVKKLGLAIDDIDRYRHSLMKSVTGGEEKELITRLKNNNRGIAERYITRIETHFRNEERRIERLKKTKGLSVIYNEELFSAARNHFTVLKGEIHSYADLSAEFTGILYSSGKSTPAEFVDSHKYSCGRRLMYISLPEKLTGSIRTLPASGGVKLQGTYRGIIPKVLASSKALLNPEPIPAQIRPGLGKEHLKEYASINAGFRTEGTLMINATRKNYDECIAGFARENELKKESALTSESRICQDETDRLFGFAKRCSEKLITLNYTEKSLNMYRDEYGRVSDDIKKGSRPEINPGKGDPGTFYSNLRGFDPLLIEREMATREIIAREGMEALSGSITLVQFYKRKGIKISIEPTDEEITAMKKEFIRNPEVTVSSWKMNGKNFRQVDANITEEFKKIVNKNGWNSGTSKVSSENIRLDIQGLTVSFSPPRGWKQLSPDSGDSNVIRFESPDRKGIIEVHSINEEMGNIQTMASYWPEKSGFSMTEKNWGKKNNADFIRSRAKNRYDGIMESYIMAASKGHILIVSGKTSGGLYRQMDKTLGELFNSLEVKEPSI